MGSDAILQNWGSYRPDHSRDAVVRGQQQTIASQQARIDDMEGILKRWLVAGRRKPEAFAGLIAETEPLFQ